MFVLYIVLYISPVSDIQLLIFVYSIGCLFIPMIVVSFAIHRLYSFMRSHLVIVGLNVSSTRNLLRMSFCYFIKNEYSVSSLLLSELRLLISHIMVLMKSFLLVVQVITQKRQGITCVWTCWYLSFFLLVFS